jgi:hypothetical protein
MKSFDIKAYRFVGRNRCQWYFSLSTAKIWWSLSLLLNQRLENNIIELSYQNWIEKILRDQICIICEVWGLEWIFHENFEAITRLWSYFFCTLLTNLIQLSFNLAQKGCNSVKNWGSKWKENWTINP